MILQLDLTMPGMVVVGTLQTQRPVDNMMMTTLKQTETAVLVEVALLVQVALLVLLSRPSDILTIQIL